MAQVVSGVSNKRYKFRFQFSSHHSLHPTGVLRTHACRASVDRWRKHDMCFKVFREMIDRLRFKMKMD